MLGQCSLSEMTLFEVDYAAKTTPFYVQKDGSAPTCDDNQPINEGIQHR